MWRNIALFCVAVGASLVVSVVGFGIYKGKIFPVCRPYVINGETIGERCHRRFAHNGFDERYDINPQYQIAFLLDLGWASRDMFEMAKPLPPQRIPGTSKHYDLLPPELDPTLPRHLRPRQRKVSL